MCSMVRVERGIINLLLFNTRALFFCKFLDATKAFDRIKYCKLFKLLLQRDLPAPIIRVLVNLYKNNLVRVSWCGAAPVFEYFVADNGVKKGAVLSPVLFCLYIDDLLLYCFLKPASVAALVLTLLAHLHTRMLSCSKSCSNACLTLTVNQLSLSIHSAISVT